MRDETKSHSVRGVPGVVYICCIILLSNCRIFELSYCRIVKLAYCWGQQYDNTTDRDDGPFEPPYDRDFEILTGKKMQLRCNIDLEITYNVAN